MWPTIATLLCYRILEVILPTQLHLILVNYPPSIPSLFPIPLTFSWTGEVSALSSNKFNVYRVETVNCHDNQLSLLSREEHCRRGRLLSLPCLVRSSGLAHVTREEVQYAMGLLGEQVLLLPASLCCCQDAAGHHAQPFCYSVCDSQITGVRDTWELVRNAQIQEPPRSRIIICILTRHS